jgi:hypothetical protein
MGSAQNPGGNERRRHFRVEGEWTIPVEAVEETGTTTGFDALALNISMSGILLETPVNANMWVDKELVVHLPGDVGPAQAFVRRFLEYAEGGRHNTRWGIEFGDLSVLQRGMWARFIFTEAHRLGQEAAHRAFEGRLDGS